MKNILWGCLLAALLVACAPSPAKPVAPARATIRIRDAVLRLPGGSGAGESASLAGYMVIENSGSVDDRLLGVTADVAGSSLLHQTLVDASGAASMQTLEAIDVPAGKTLSLSPGGYHVMFADLKRELKIGDRAVLALTFEKAGVIVMPAPITGP